MTLLRGGRTLYGHALGVLMLDTRFPRPRGDIGNATTWPFPVRYKIVKGAVPHRVIGESDPDLLRPFIDGARELADGGVRAITTSCGFLAIFQQELAAAVPVPVVASSLLQVPLAAAAIGRHRRVAIVTAREELTERHFNGVGWSSRDIPVIVKAPPPDGMFANIYATKQPEDGQPVADPEVLERELVGTVDELLAEHPDVGAVVMECANFVPYSQAVRRATGLPVFDLYTLVMNAYEATTGTDFPL